ncbi:MAG: J domain-containing protein [Bdellovibrionaceae bacterium]|nr:J domain-containing protein [Pseudobdellovibrionaceae bacterium]
MSKKKVHNPQIFWFSQRGKALSQAPFQREKQDFQREKAQNCHPPSLENDLSDRADLGMGKSMSFAEILREKICETPCFQRGNHGPNGSTDPLGLAWLMGQISPFARVAPLSAYPRRPRPRPKRTYTTAQRKALEFFLSQGVNLDENFFPAELKNAFRTLAKRLHPDLNPGRGAADFIALKAAYANLELTRLAVDDSTK